MKSSELLAITEAALDFCSPEWRKLPPLMRQAVKDGMMTHIHEAYLRTTNTEYNTSK
jgi:hypothetical protein